MNRDSAVTVRSRPRIGQSLAPQPHLRAVRFLTEAGPFSFRPGLSVPPFRALASRTPECLPGLANHAARRSLMSVRPAACRLPSAAHHEGRRGSPERHSLETGWEGGNYAGDSRQTIRNRKRDVKPASLAIGCDVDR